MFYQTFLLVQFHFNTSHVTVYQVSVYPPSTVVTDFNTSHVTVYQGRKTFLFYCILYFNTSHVTVYLVASVGNTVSVNISIHLMLLFICVQFFSCHTIILISIHLMLLFIKNNYTRTETAPIFQYISCYCLSGQPYVPTAGGANFNTSHVTVYRIPITPTEVHLSFQYISCYCLSVSDLSNALVSRISIHLMLLFIVSED